MAAVAASWAISCAFMTNGTVTDASAQRAWGIWFAMVAVCLTGWAIADYVSRKQRLRLEELAEIMAAEAARYYSGDSHLSRVH